MNEITEIRQLMGPPPGLRSDTIHAARQQLVQAATAPVRKRRRWVLPVVTTASAAAAAVGVLAAVNSGGQPQTATLTAWTVHRAADNTVTVTVREFRDPAGLQRSLLAAGVPAFVQSGANPCPVPFPAIPANGSMLGRVLQRDARRPSGLAFTIHPNAIPPGAILDLMFPSAGSDKTPVPVPTGLPSALAGAGPLRGVAALHPLAIRLIPSHLLQCLQPAPEPAGS